MRGVVIFAFPIDNDDTLIKTMISTVAKHNRKIMIMSTMSLTMMRMITMMRMMKMIVIGMIRNIKIRIIRIMMAILLNIKNKDSSNNES